MCNSLNLKIKRGVTWPQNKLSLISTFLICLFRMTCFSWSFKTFLHKSGPLGDFFGKYGNERVVTNEPICYSYGGGDVGRGGGISMSSGVTAGFSHSPAFGSTWPAFWLNPLLV